MTSRSRSPARAGSVPAFLAVLSCLGGCGGDATPAQGAPGGLTAGAAGVSGGSGKAGSAGSVGGQAGGAGHAGGGAAGGNAGASGKAGTGPGGTAGAAGTGGAAAAVHGVACDVPVESPSQGACADQLLGATPAECNPITHAGCDAGEVCAWETAVSPSLCKTVPSPVPICGPCGATKGPFCGAGLTCIDGVCAKLCCDDGDCGAARCLAAEPSSPGGLPNPFGGPKGPHCVECLGDADCKDPTKPACSAAHACSPVKGCCEVNVGVLRCGDPAVTACVCQHDPSCCVGGWSDACVEAIARYGCGAPCPGTCATDGDCGPSLVCAGNQCVPPCTSGADCSTEGGKCDPGGHCGECFGDGDCTSPLGRCDPATRLCVFCLGDDDCSPDKPHCPSPFGGCKQCLVDAECSGATPYCVSGVCSNGDLCDGGGLCKNPKKGLCDPVVGLCKAKSQCCDGPASTPGCPQHPALEACVCAKLPSCCTGTWGSECDTAAYALGCGPCEGGCASDDDCTDPSKPACNTSAHVCVECSDDFDCKAFGEPSCTFHTCQPADGAVCAGDDPSEPADDHPAASVDLTPAPGGTKSLSAHLCRASSAADFYRLTVGPNEDVTAKAEPSDGKPLLLQVFDERGELRGVGWTNPGKLTLTHLPQGTYHLAVSPIVVGGDFSTAAVPYTVEVTRSKAQPCAGVADCSAEFEGQFLRGGCDGGSGACVPIEGKGSVQDGGSCDSDDDCLSGGCAVRAFTADAHLRAFCARDCSFGKACEPGQVCSPQGTGYHCLDVCKTDLDCPVVPNPVTVNGTWIRLHCDGATGKCSL